MKKWSREQLNEALDKLKELRKEEAYSGVLPYRFAMCYLPAPRYFYDWDRLPGSYTCPVCGHPFGRKEAKGKKIRDFDLGGEDDNEETAYYPYKVQVETWDFDTVRRAYLEARELGYDASLLIFCAECITKKQFPPIIFKFRASENTDYTISYPQIGDIDGNSKKGASRTLFLPHEYATAISFLKEIVQEANIEHNISLDQTCRTWLNKFAWEITYEGRPWSTIMEALNGILGLSVEE